jgi:hydroxyacylglutathione hydrolase
MTLRMRWFVVGFGTVLAVLAAGLVSAPTVYFELFVAQHGETPSVLPRPALGRGQWFDDYFVIESIDEATFAIGEPRYYQGNYSYLLLGRERALLFDAGSGLRDVAPVVRALTHLPVTVLPSHLHFDHVGALGHFDRIALPDDPSLRARERNGLLRLGRYEFLGAMDRRDPPTLSVDDWWSDGQRIDLGGRTVEVWRTPGHTPTSVSIWEASRALLLVGDFLYPGELYAFLPGASLSAYEASASRLLRRLPADARLYAAHMQDAPALPAAPLLHRHDLEALEGALIARRMGQLPSVGFYPQIYPVAGAITLATGFRWNLR